ncbi:hypothetical protein [Peribacillus asahii]|uniref:hypothetical protein n=1 Tax=Peribacillus asahii TaxID=228899 RepID=UPI003826F84E
MVTATATAVSSAPEPSFFSDLYTLWGQLSSLSGWASIISFILTIYLLFTTAGIKDKVQRSYKFKAFKQDKTGIMNELHGIKNLIIHDPKDTKNLYDLAEPLRRLNDYTIYMDRQDKKAFKELKSAVKSGSAHEKSDQVIYNLGVLIGFLKKRIDIDLDSM